MSSVTYLLFSKWFRICKLRWYSQVVRIIKIAAIQNYLICLNDRMDFVQVKFVFHAHVYLNSNLIAENNHGHVSECSAIR